MEDIFFPYGVPIIYDKAAQQFEGIWKICMYKFGGPPQKAGIKHLLLPFVSSTKLMTASLPEMINPIL